MPATEPTTADIPRAVRHRIVSMLARLMYPAERIARENHVTVEIVEALRAEHGPGVKELCEAAEWLARPAKADKPKPTPTTGDGLASTEERRACRAWALTTGRTTAGTGPLGASVVAEWVAAGRPIVEVTPKPRPKPEPEPEPTPETDPDPEPIVVEVAGEAADEQAPAELDEDPEEDDELVEEEVPAGHLLELAYEGLDGARFRLHWATLHARDLVEALTDQLSDFATAVDAAQAEQQRLDRVVAALQQLARDGRLEDLDDLRAAARAVLEAAA